MSGAGEKTEKPTPRRLKKARRDGQVGHSPELGSWLGVLAATFVLPAVARSLMSTAQTSMVQVGATIRNPDVGQALGMTRWALLHAATGLAPAASGAVAPCSRIRAPRRSRCRRCSSTSGPATRC